MTRPDTQKKTTLSTEFGASHSLFRVVGSRGLSVAMAPTASDSAARQIEMKTESRLKF